MNIMGQIISESVIDVSALFYFVPLYVTVVGLSQMMEQLQHLLHPLWLLCWYS